LTALRRRFDDHRAASRQRRPNLPCIDVDRVVPRGNRAHHADGRCDNEATHVGTHGSPDGAADPAPFFGVVADNIDAEANLLDRVGNWLSLLASEQVRNGVETFNDEVGGSVKNPGALVGVRPCPKRQSAFGGGDSVIDVLRVRDRG
jgi:hypothetical protein